MAKHIVICSICKESFDASKVPYVKTCKGRRYAHETCSIKEEQEKLRIEQDKQALEEYIKYLFKEDKINDKIQKQLKYYLNEKKYTYSGIHKALVYFFEIKGGALDKANGGIGIVEYVYQNAYNYYYALWEAQ